jgi:hypothetical protein
MSSLAARVVVVVVVDRYSRTQPQNLKDARQSVNKLVSNFPLKKSKIARLATARHRPHRAERRDCTLPRVSSSYSAPYRAHPRA